ncbi:hypothetical protein KL864_33765, partial [Mycolicibacterium goodii]|uniref:hypothetical protein n=1 Tax=Mycolicibacterium goodii TaxID=134601 RepID=UPI001BDD9634
LPNQRANAGLDRDPVSVMIILGKVRPLSRHLAEAHPQVLIIALSSPSTYPARSQHRRLGNDLRSNTRSSPTV